MKRFLSSNSLRKPSFSVITAKERQSLNRTSLSLYKILLKVISRDDASKSGFILLQPAVNSRDYGQAKIVDATKSLLWTNQVSQRQKVTNEELCANILSFSKVRTEEVGERDETKVVGNFDELFGIAVDENDANDENDNDSNQDLDAIDLSLYVSHLDLKNAIRKGFEAGQDIDKALEKIDIIRMQKVAIDSINLLEDQKLMWDRTSISTDEKKGIRVIAVSRCIGVSTGGHPGLNEAPTVRHKFAYRIRIENFNEPGSDKSVNVQLLGRKWRIEEDEDAEDSNKVMKVDAPTTGAVGHLPVIRPGEAFEYISGCDLHTLTGTLSGSFYMTEVDDDAESCQVGDPTNAFDLPKERHFEMEVLPVKLVADEV